MANTTLQFLNLAGLTTFATAIKTKYVTDLDGTINDTQGASLYLKNGNGDKLEASEINIPIATSGKAGIMSSALFKTLNSAIQSGKSITKTSADAMTADVNWAKAGTTLSIVNLSDIPSATKVGVTDTLAPTVDAVRNYVTTSINNVVTGESIVKSFGGQKGDIVIDNITTTDGHVKFTMSGQKLTGSVNGWAGLVSTVDSKAAQTDLTDAVTRITKLETTTTNLGNNKADTAVAIKSVKVAGNATANESTVTATVTVTPTTADNKPHPDVSGSFSIPAASAAAAGVVTLNKITEIAALEAGKAATSAYKVKGTKATLAEVLAVSPATIGDVYNISTEFTLVGKKYPAGTNVVFIGAKEGNDPKQETQWDALGGTVDLSSYATTASVTNTLKSYVKTTDSRITNIALNTDEAAKGNVAISITNANAPTPTVLVLATPIPSESITNLV